MGVGEGESRDGMREVLESVVVERIEKGSDSMGPARGKGKLLYESTGVDSG